MYGGLIGLSRWVAMEEATTELVCTELVKLIRAAVRWPECGDE